MAYDVCERCGMPLDREGQMLCSECRREALLEHIAAGKKTVPKPIRTPDFLTGDKTGEA